MSKPCTVVHIHVWCVQGKPGTRGQTEDRLDKLVNSRFNETLSQKMRQRATEEEPMLTVSL